MATRNLEKLASIDAQLRALVPGKVSEDDKLVEYDALLLDSFLDILQDLHGEDLKETVQECYELSAEYEGGKHDSKKLEELGSVLTSLDPGDSIVIAKAFSHMLNLANLAEEVQIAYRRRQKLKKGDFVDENNATTESDIEETFKKLVGDLKKSPQEVFDALKNQTVDLVLTAHPTQSVRRSLLQSMEGSEIAWLSFMLKTLHPMINKSLMRLYRGRFKLLSAQMRFGGLLQLHRMK